MAKLLRMRWLRFGERFLNKLGEIVDSHEKGVNQILSGICLVTYFFYAYIVCFRLNVLQIDHAGHIASMVAFSRGWFHHFNDQHFLGWVHNLFYPPLEDAIGGALIKIGIPPITAYKVYLLLVLAAYLGAILYFLKSIPPRFRIICFAILFFLINVQKRNLSEFQGLSFVDLWLTGLSSQMLSGIFFFLFLKEFFSQTMNRSRAFVVLCLLLVSHIVMALVVVALIGIRILCDRNLRLLPVLTASFLVTSFFWIPFLAYKSQIIPSMIYGPFRMLGEIAIAVLGVYFSWKHIPIRAAFATAFCLLAPMAIGPTVERWGLPVPAFHYYRFAMPALMLLTASLTWFSVVTNKIKNEAFVKFALWAIFILLTFQTHSWQRFNFSWPSLTPVNAEDLKSIDFSSDQIERAWIVHADRPADFGVDSLLALRSENMQFAKGLFWESGQSNALVSSYLATLLGTPVVLDYFFFYGYSCEVQACLMDSFSRSFNVSRWIFPLDLGKLPTKELRKNCYRKILADDETEHFLVSKQPGFEFRGLQWSVSQLSPKDSSFQNATVEIINPSQVSWLQDGLPEGFHSQSLKRTFAACSKGVGSKQRVDMGLAAYTRFARARSDVMGRQDRLDRLEAKLLRVKSGYYEVDVASERDELLWVKLNPVPGLRVYDSAGREGVIEPAYPGFLTAGRGKLRIEYARPALFWISYFLSAVSFCCLAWIFLRKRIPLGPSSRLTP